MNTEIKNARVTMDNNGQLRVSISITSTTDVKIGKKISEVSVNDVIRCTGMNTEMNMEIVKDFWNEVQKVVDSEINDE